MDKAIHIAVTRWVKPGCEEQFEKELLTFFSKTLSMEGSLGAHLLRPIPDSGDRTYGILRSFKTREASEKFYHSVEYSNWVSAIYPLVEKDYSRREISGLEAFFNQQLLNSRPPEWKLALITWLGVWPSVFFVTTLLSSAPLSDWPMWWAVGRDTFVVVILLTWFVMPVLTKLFKGWLAPRNERV